MKDFNNIDIIALKLYAAHVASGKYVSSDGSINTTIESFYRVAELFEGIRKLRNESKT